MKFTDEQIDAGAVALLRRNRPGGAAWHQLDEGERYAYREDARAVLEAATRELMLCPACINRECEECRGTGYVTL